MLLLKCRLEVLKLINLSDEGVTEGLDFFARRKGDKKRNNTAIKKEGSPFGN